MQLKPVLHRGSLLRNTNIAVATEAQLSRNSTVPHCNSQNVSRAGARLSGTRYFTQMLQGLSNRGQSEFKKIIQSLSNIKNFPF